MNTNVIQSKKRIFIPETEEQNIIYLYNIENKKINEIKHLYGCSHIPILRILNKHKIIKKSALFYKRNINVYQEKELCKAYQAGINTPELSHTYHISTATVNRWLKRNNVKMRLQKESKRIHKFKDEEFFNCIDTEAKAYFLGLLWTDGCNFIKKKNNTHINHVIISLKEEDKHILDTMCSYLYFNNKILYYKKTKKDYNRQNQYCLRIVSRHISETLFKYGMTPRKSFTLSLPNCIPSHLLNHFIRGMWDGDGCISYNKQSKNFMCGFIGSPNSCKELKDIINKFSSVNFCTQDLNKCSKPLSNLSIHGNNKCKKFLDWLYYNSNASLRLYRKYNKYQELLKKFT